MHKISMLLGVVSLLAVFLTGCAGVHSPVSNGLIYTDVQGPVAATGLNSSSKCGKASCVSVLGLISTGDASIAAAQKQANITKIHHVDHESFSVLGLYAEFTTIVYGE